MRRGMFQFNELGGLTPLKPALLMRTLAVCGCASLRQAPVMQCCF